jgi:hypothetical protein
MTCRLSTGKNPSARGKAAFASAQSLCRGSYRASNATSKAGLSELGAEQIDCLVARAVGWQDSLDAQLAQLGNDGLQLILIRYLQEMESTSQ